MKGPLQRKIKKEKFNVIIEIKGMNQSQETLLKMKTCLMKHGGLLISIASYPENFKLYKYELYKRSEKIAEEKSTEFGKN